MLRLFEMESIYGAQQPVHFMAAGRILCEREAMKCGGMYVVFPNLHMLLSLSIKSEQKCVYGYGKRGGRSLLEYWYGIPYTGRKETIPYHKIPIWIRNAGMAKMEAFSGEMVMGGFFILHQDALIRKGNG